MSKIKYEGSEQFRPISAWGYLGYLILFCIPVIGQIILIVFACSNKNINRRNYARSFLCALLAAVIINMVIAVYTCFILGNGTETLKERYPFLRQPIEAFERSSTRSTRSNISEHTNAPIVRTTTQSATSTPANAKQTTAPKHTSAPTTVPTKQPTKAPTAAIQTATPTAKPSSSSNTAGVRKEVEDAIDSYEEFFRKYANFMKKYSTSSNPLSMLSDYSSMMTQYADTMAKWERFDKDYDLNDAETKYYLDATIRIEKILLDAM